MNGIKNNWLDRIEKIVIAAALAVTTIATSHADLASVGINLGNANTFSVFALSDGIQVTGGTAGVPDIQGNIGSAGSGITIADYVKIGGSVYLKTGQTFQKIGTHSSITGSVVQSTSTNTFLANASSSANSASAYAFTLASTAGFPSSIDLVNQNLTLNAGTKTKVVLNLHDFEITNGVLTLFGTANTTYVINVLACKQFDLNSGKVVLSGGLLASNVLFNVSNLPGGVTLTSSSLSGTILAPKTKITLVSSKVTGKVIGKQVIISGSAPSVVSP